MKARDLSYEEYCKVACPSCGRKNGSGHGSLCLKGKLSEEIIKDLFERGKLE